VYARRILRLILARLVSFLSQCVLPLVPGYVSMLSGIGTEQLRRGQRPRAGLLGSSLSFVAGFSVVFITFGASASAVGQFLRQNRAVLAPVAGALILLFGLHLVGWLAKLSFRVGLDIGAVFVAIGLFSAWQGGGIISGFHPIHFISLSMIGFLGPVVATLAESRRSSEEPEYAARCVEWFSSGVRVRIWVDALHWPNSGHSAGSRRCHRHGRG